MAELFLGVLFVGVVIYVLRSKPNRGRAQRVAPVKRSTDRSSRGETDRHVHDDDDLLLTGAVLVGALSADGADARERVCGDTTIDVEYEVIEDDSSDGGGDCDGDD